MPKYSQKDRVLAVHTNLGEDVLLLEGVSGTEGVSRPFHFTLRLLSEDPAIDPESLLREPVSFSIGLPDGTRRYINGRISRFTQLGGAAVLHAYQAEVVPWLWFLSLSNDCRIFQNKSVPEIIEEIFADYPDAEFSNKCMGSYPAREYCVQYRESDLAFVSRLMAEEGIFYFFEHTDSSHQLVLADDPSTISPCAQKEARVTTTPEGFIGEDIITTLERELAVHPTVVTITDYNALQPSLDLQSSASDGSYEEVYDYPGRFLETAEGERYAGLWLEALSAHREMVRGTSRVRAFASGHQFNLVHYPVKAANKAYLLLFVEHEAVDASYRSPESSEGTEYRNRFECIPASVHYRPPRNGSKPTVRGTQTAVVVGPAGEEVYTDKHGRVKVQFHWDREGKGDENSSCWVRVASPWAGKGYGSVSVPRIGNEVVVDFLEGDPDRPIIMSSVYNGEQMPPFQLPGSGIQMGMKSRSSPGGGGNNEITMTDTKGKELVNVNAQYDMTTTVGNDQKNTIGNNRTTSVAVDDEETIGSNQTISIGGDRTADVGGNDSTSVGGNQAVSVSGNMSVDVGGDASSTAGGAQSLSSGGHTKIKAGASLFASASGSAIVQVGSSVIATAGSLIKLQCGGSSITLLPGAIMIKSGGSIKISGAGPVKVQGALVTVTGGMVKVNS
jgi:type VI secretion system secreted protein VgrG